MNKSYLLTAIISLIFTLTAKSQADLVISNGSLLSTNISVGDYLAFTFRVKNIGNSTAVKSHTKIYVSSTPIISANSFLLSDISTESLVGNQETQDVNYIYPLPYNIPTGTKYVIMSVDSRNEVSESNENNGFAFNTQIVIDSAIGGQQNLPYPIILIHGLNSNDATWYPFLIDMQNYYGYSYGGNMDFCLNQDGNTATSNSLNDMGYWTDISQLAPADFVLAP